MNKLLIIEDDIILNETLTYNLLLEGYSAIGVFTCLTAESALLKETFDLIILDVNLPDGNGFDLCKKIKNSYHVPIIFLTANDLEQSMIKGFELGADDYVTKPFPISVFMLKIKAVLGRVITQGKRDSFDDGRLVIDFLSLTATILGENVVFTPLEYRTLKLFTQNPNIVLTRQMLLERLWDTYENFVDEHTLTSVISRLRSKIESKEIQYIKTVYGMGYMWVGENK